MGTRNWPRRSSSTRTIYLGRHYDYKELEDSSVKFPSAKNINNDAGAGLKKQYSWKTLWRKLLKEKNKIFEPSVQVKSPYDVQSYMQNFDDGQILDDESDNDLVSRSFSMRFADPSKLFHEKDIGM